LANAWLWSRVLVHTRIIPVLHHCVEEIEKKKQQEIQTHKQERSTWHVSILPAISPGVIEREGRVKFCEEGKSLTVRRFLQIHSETNTTTAIVAGLELVQD